MSQKTLTKADLAQFIGTEQYYRHGLMAKVIYTDGVRYVAEKAGAYWLIDEIAFAQAEPAVAKQPFQFWHLKVAADYSAMLTCSDGNDGHILTRTIPFTDFPLDEMKFYFIDNTLLLPSEY